MAEQLSVEVLLQEHLAISTKLKSLADTANDMFSMINLKETSEWTTEQLQELDQKQLILNALFNSLEEDLKKHYSDEDTFLRLYLGPYMLEAISREVTAIMEQSDRVKSLFISTDIKGTNRENSLVKSLAIRQAIENLTRQIEARNQKVDSVLKLLKSVIGT